jgi:hypothetical protein
LTLEMGIRSGVFSGNAGDLAATACSAFRVA